MSFSLKGYRTIIFNGIAFTTGLLELLSQLDLAMGGFLGLSPEGAALIMAITGVNMFLRYITNTSLFKDYPAV